MAGTRETEIIQAFTGLADRLVDDYDVVDLTTRLSEDCASLLDVAAAGILLADVAGTLHLLAATSAEARKLEAFQLQREEGPCFDCFHSGAPVSIADLDTETTRWPRFVVAAAEQGFASVHAIPMTFRGARLGALGLFGTSAGTLGDDDLHLAQGLAHVASIAIVQNSVTADRATVLPAVQSAVAGRAVVEMANGVLAQAHAVDIGEAFVRLRTYARGHDKHLTDVARQVVSRKIAPSELLPG